MSQENEPAARRAHENVARSPEDYDDEGRPAAARARDADTAPGEPTAGREGTGDGEDTGDTGEAGGSEGGDGS